MHIFVRGLWERPMADLFADEDFQELAGKGIWLAKAGFGNVKTPYDMSR